MDILYLTVALQVIGGQANTQLTIDEGFFDGSLGIERVEVSVADLSESVRTRQRRTPRDEVDRSAGCIATKQRALGSPQDLHPIEVKEAHPLARTRRNVDIIDINADRRCLIGVVFIGDADAAQRKIRLGIAVRTADLKIRDRAGQLG